MDSVIEFDDVTYTYPLTKSPAVSHVSFALEKGSFTGVIGANGSGKTTLCALIRGFAPSFYKGEVSGEIRINGRPIQTFDKGELALNIGYVFQNPFNQISGVKKTVFEEIAYGLELFGVSVDEIEGRVVDVMRMTDIEHIAFKNPFELSGGQQQRVALASTLVLEPDILVIDEPTSQLDPAGTESVFRVISAMKEKHKTIVLVEHKVDLIAEYADRVLVLEGARLIADGPTHDVLSDISLYEEHGVQIPQISILGNRLRERGFAFPRIPVTESEAVRSVSEGLRKGWQ